MTRKIREFGGNKVALREMLVHLYLSKNLTRQETATQLGLSISGVRYYLKKFKITKPSSSIKRNPSSRKKYSDAAKLRLADSTSHPHFYKEIDSQLIADLYTAGWSKRSIATKLGVDPSVVSLRLKMLKVPPPPKAKWNLEQTSFLKSNWGLLPPTKIAQVLHTTLSSVYHKARTLQLRGGRARRITAQRTGKFVHCAHCGKMIYRPKIDIRHLNFCSHGCQGKVLRPSQNQIRNALLANRKKPNKLELSLDTILQEHFPAQFAYNGNLSCGVMLRSLVPDFVNVNGQKMVIELFGDYWHGDEKTANRWKATEFGRKAVYSQLGFKCAVIWEHELSDPCLVIQKIKEAF